MKNTGENGKVKVALVKCTDYNYENVLEAVKKGIELLGGYSVFANKGEKLLLKPNMLSADAPEKASITHYAVVKAVASVLKDNGALLSYGDSPGFHKPTTAATKTGIATAMAELDIPAGDFDNGREIFYENGKQNKKFTIANAVLDNDGVISICKLKTHGLTRMTGAIKNQFGCIPGKLKGEFHARVPDPVDFCKMLVDLNMYIKPRLFVMDGIVGMEGNGPRNGVPRNVNVLLFSTDPVALDSVACQIINLSPEFVPTITFGKESQLGTYLEEEIEIVGESIETFSVLDFQVTRKPVKAMNLGNNFIVSIFRKFILNRPVINVEKCVKCGVCVEVCPVNPKALSQTSDCGSDCCCQKSDSSATQTKTVPTYDYSKCIRCFCCQELCPHGAINIKSPFIRRIFSKKLPTFT